jgi:pentose-5-phosphate-3-epimerase
MLIPKPDKDTTIKQKISLLNVDAKMINKTLETISKSTYKIIHHDLEGFIPEKEGYFNLHISIKVIHHIKNEQKPCDYLNRCRKII